MSIAWQRSACRLQGCPPVLLLIVAEADANVLAQQPGGQACGDPLITRAGLHQHAQPLLSNAVCQRHLGIHDLHSHHPFHALIRARSPALCTHVSNAARMV